VAELERSELTETPEARSSSGGWQLEATFAAYGKMYQEEFPLETTLERLNKFQSAESK